MLRLDRFAGGGGLGGSLPISLGPNNPLTNPLAPTTGRGAMPAPQTSGLDLGGIDLEGLGQAGCQLIKNPVARAACMAIAGSLPSGGGGTNNPGRGTDNSGQRPTTGGWLPLEGGATNCPAGYVSDGKGGCRIQGIGSYIPGDIGMVDTGWTPTAGMYGVGVSPLPVQRMVRACPAGFVLGKDGVCYDRLARSHRAHNPGRKPLLTGGDMNALARARSLQKKIGKINTRFGPKKRPAHTHASHHRKK